MFLDSLKGDRFTVDSDKYYKMGQLVVLRNQNAVKDTLWQGPGKIVAFDRLAGYNVEFNNKVTKRNIQDLKEWTTVNSEKFLPKEVNKQVITETDMEKSLENKVG
eukprot:TRINITY_DN5205_c0_g1_i13.p2 TRINITY_DN5205_c0_g1~~TRINITY_DN5205_c0_g1_i13.p2  ORF type:complete len:105 (-),score=14.46 TRINITY_DN5205_c0_g1_i13:146-460(-)